MLSGNQVLETSESTNNDARRLAEAGCAHGTWISAKRQTAGRGRLGREWRSLEGNLFLSIVVRPTFHPSHLGWVPLATAVAVAEAVRDLRPALELEIKWPNDLLLGRAKVGGILCEGVRNYVILGIGLNCVQSPGNLDQKTASLSSVLPESLHADQVRLPIVNSVLSSLDELMRGGPAPIASLYEKRAALRRGTLVEWSSGAPGAPVTAGEVEGLGSGGELCVKDLSGREHRLYADEVKLRELR